MIRTQFIQARETILSSLGSRLEQKEGEVKQREMEVDVARREAATKVGLKIYATKVGLKMYATKVDSAVFLYN